MDYLWVEHAGSSILRNLYSLVNMMKEQWGKN